MWKWQKVVAPALPTRPRYQCLMGTWNQSEMSSSVTTKMLLTLSPDMQNAFLRYVTQFKDVCSIALVSKEMAALASRKRRSMVEQRQLRVQCGRCLNNFRAPGATLFYHGEYNPQNNGWPWECPACPAVNEVSQAFSAVVSRDGWHVPGRRCHIRVAGEESDLVMMPHILVSTSRQVLDTSQCKHTS
jgi:hypothetical protein